MLGLPDISIFLGLAFSSILDDVDSFCLPNKLYIHIHIYVHNMYKVYIYVSHLAVTYNYLLHISFSFHSFYTLQITRIPNSCSCSCSCSSQKASHGNISGTKRVIIDRLVSKKPETNS